MLNGQVAIVTGASRGIGACILDALARANATVIGTSTTQKGAEGITRALGELGARGAGRVLRNARPSWNRRRRSSARRRSS
jgi:3-oxoacyl-[acyl-carrier protein] reductase